MNRLVVFADPRHLAARILLPALLEEIARGADMECVAIMVPESAASRWQALRWRWRRARRRLQAALGSGRWERALDHGPVDLPRLARRYGVEVRQIPGDDPNHPDTVRYVSRDRRADLALNLYYLKPFRGELLGCFEVAANFHNGSLPEFRGLWASNWPIYMGQPTSGYTFHRMDESLDTGDVLCSGEVPVDAGETPADLELRKAVAAGRLLPALLGALSRREPGCPQRRIACLHNHQAYELMTRVADAAALSRQEWERRLRAFLRIVTWLEGRWWPVTGVVPCEGGGRLSFRSADGQWLRVTGVDFWPAGWMRGSRHAG